MTIETKYNIGDLVQGKYTLSPDTDATPVILEVQFIDVNTCIAGAQIFYNCRPHLIEYYKNFDDTVKEGRKVKSIHTNRNDSNGQTGAKYREDELKPCPEEYKKILQS